MEKNKLYYANIDIMRVFFLFSIIAAHSSVTRIEITGKWSEMIWKIWQVWSCIGVPGFLIISGYLFKEKQESFILMTYKKVQSIIIPWIVCGVIIYFICNYPKIGVKEMIQFIIGYNSYLYYNLILLGCFFIFYLLPYNLIFFLFCIIINILSLYFTQYGIYHAVFTNFLNIINWIGYFAVGCVFKKYHILLNIKSQSIIIQWLIIALSTIIFICAVLSGIENYFNWFMFVVGVGIVIGIYCFCSFERINKIPYISKIGKWAFTIYLLHMPLVAVAKKIVRWICTDLYVLIPFVIILIFCIVLEFIQKLSDKSRFFKYITKILGMR